MNKEIIKQNSISISDLSEWLIQYKNTISKYKKYDFDELENLLLYEDKETITHALLDYVFTLVLTISPDELIFEELLADANEELIRSIYSYDKTIHKDFKTYLTININNVISENLYNYLSNNDSFENTKTALDYETKIIERTDYSILLKSIIEEVNLSPLEKRVIEYRYGLIDGIQWDYLDIAQELKLNKLSVMHHETNAIKKLQRTKKEME